MKDSGCIQIDCGWESGSEKMLEIMNKQAKSEDYIRFSNDCRDVGIRILANMMINLPGETLSDIDESIELIKKTEPNVTLWGEYIPIPGVKFGREMSLDDLNTFGTDRSIIEDKYKFAAYDETLKSVLDNITKIFPNPRNPHLIIKWSYVKRWKDISLISLTVDIYRHYCTVEGKGNIFQLGDSSNNERCVRRM
jgi:radical SAM superfamily enzyme YgiQ (UPF0313 family)